MIDMSNFHKWTIDCVQNTGQQHFMLSYFILSTTLLYLFPLSAQHYLTHHIFSLFTLSTIRFLHKNLASTRAEIFVCLVHCCFLCLDEDMVSSICSVSINGMNKYYYSYFAKKKLNLEMLKKKKIRDLVAGSPSSPCFH